MKNTQELICVVCLFISSFTLLAELQYNPSSLDSLINVATNVANNDSERENSLRTITDHYSKVNSDSMLIWVNYGLEQLSDKNIEFNSWLLNMKGDAFFQKGEFTNAKTSFVLALEQSKNYQDIKNTMLANEGISRSFLYVGAKDSVTHYAINALKSAETLKDTSTQIKVLFNLYQVQNQLRNETTSLKYLNQAAYLVEASDATQWMGKLYMNKGIHYYLIASKEEHRDSVLYNNSLDSCMLYYSKGKIAYKNDGNIKNEAVSLANMALVYQEKFEWQKAYDFFKEARDIVNPSNNQHYIIGFGMGMAHSLSKLGKSKEALPILFDAVDFYKISQNAEKIADCYNNISQAYADMGDYKNALKYKNGQLNTKLEAYDSLTIKQITQLEKQYESEKKESEIQRLSLEEKLNQTQISRQRLALGGSVLGLSILSFLLYRLFGQNKKIDSQNQVISKALSEKETLLKEIHHRVKNNLQVISSLLRIQSNQTEDEIAIDALKEGQSRVQAMSLIHEDLYQHDDLKAIKIKEYLEKLSNSIFQTYDITDSNIELTTDIDDIELDIDTVVPLGLIVNELITNSLKYAFPDGHEGLIHLSLNRGPGDIRIVLKDNGIGSLGNPKESGFGTGLIQSLVNKLNGQIMIETENGTQTTLIIPLDSA